MEPQVPQTTPPTPPVKKRLSRKGIVIIIVGVIVLAALTFGVTYFITKSSNDAANDGQTTNPPETQQPIVLDEQDQPIPEAATLITEGSAALGKRNYDEARQKYAAARDIYAAAGKDVRATDAEGLIQAVDVEEEAYKAAQESNPNFDGGPLIPTGNTGN